MDAEDSVIRVGRTLWNVWCYISGAVNRFFRTEPVNIVANDAESSQESSANSERANSSETDSMGRREVDEEPLAKVSCEKPVVAWNVCTTDIKEESKGEEALNKGDDTQEVQVAQAGNYDTELPICKEAEKDEQEGGDEFGVQTLCSLRQDEMEGRDDEEDVSSVMLGAVGETVSEDGKENARKADAESEMERTVMLDDCQKMDGTQAKSQEKEKETDTILYEDEQDVEEEDTHELCITADLSLNEEGNLEEQKVQRDKADKEAMLQKVEVPDGALLITSENENKSEEEERQENQLLVCDKFSDTDSFQPEPSCTSDDLKNASYAVSEDGGGQEQVTLFHRSDSVGEDVKETEDEGYLHGASDEQDTSEDDGQEEDISAGHVACSEGVVETGKQVEFKSEIKTENQAEDEMGRSEFDEKVSLERPIVTWEVITTESNQEPKEESSDIETSDEDYDTREEQTAQAGDNDAELLVCKDTNEDEQGDHSTLQDERRLRDEDDQVSALPFRATGEAVSEGNEENTRKTGAEDVAEWAVSLDDDEKMGKTNQQEEREGEDKQELEAEAEEESENAVTLDDHQNMDETKTEIQEKEREEDKMAHEDEQELEAGGADVEEQSETEDTLAEHHDIDETMAMVQEKEDDQIAYEDEQELEAEDSGVEEETEREVALDDHQRMDETKTEIQETEREYDITPHGDVEAEDGDVGVESQTPVALDDHHKTDETQTEIEEKESEEEDELGSEAEDGDVEFKRTVTLDDQNMDETKTNIQEEEMEDDQMSHEDKEELETEESRVEEETERQVTLDGQQRMDETKTEIQEKEREYDIMVDEDVEAEDRDVEVESQTAVALDDHQKTDETQTEIQEKESEEEDELESEPEDCDVEADFERTVTLVDQKMDETKTNIQEEEMENGQIPHEDKEELETEESGVEEETEKEVTLDDHQRMYETKTEIQEKEREYDIMANEDVQAEDGDVEVESQTTVDLDDHQKTDETQTEIEEKESEEEDELESEAEDGDVEAESERAVTLDDHQIIHKTQTEIEERKSEEEDELVSGAEGGDVESERTVTLDDLNMDETKTNVQEKENEDDQIAHEDEQELEAEDSGVEEETEKEVALDDHQRMDETKTEIQENETEYDITPHEDMAEEEELQTTVVQKTGKVQTEIQEKESEEEGELESEAEDGEVESERTVTLDDQKMDETKTNIQEEEMEDDQMSHEDEEELEAEESKLEENAVTPDDHQKEEVAQKTDKPVKMRENHDAESENQVTGEKSVIPEDERFLAVCGPEEKGLCSGLDNKESYINADFAATSVTVSPEGETGQEISEEFKNIPQQIREGQPVVLQELNNPACEETKEGVPGYNNVLEAEENTTQRFLEVGDAEEIQNTQLPEEVEHKELESLQNSDCSTGLEHFLATEQTHAEQESTEEEIKISFVSEQEQVGDLNLPEETDAPLAPAVTEEPGLLFEKEEDPLLADSMKTEIKHFGQEFEMHFGFTDETGKTTKELQGSSEEPLVEYEVEERLCEDEATGVGIDEEILDLWIETAMSEDTVGLEQDAPEPGQQTDTEIKPSNGVQGEISSVQAEQDQEQLIQSNSVESESVSDIEMSLAIGESGFLDQSVSECDTWNSESQLPKSTSKGAFQDILDKMSDSPGISEVYAQEPTAEIQETTERGQSHLKVEESVKETGFDPDSGHTSPEALDEEQMPGEKDEETGSQSVTDIAAQETGLKDTEEDVDSMTETNTLSKVEEAKVEDEIQRSDTGRPRNGSEVLQEESGADICTESEEKLPSQDKPQPCGSEVMTDSVPGLKRDEMTEQPWTEFEDQMEVDTPGLDFTAQRSRIAVKNPHVRPPKDPRSLLNMPSLDPTPSPQLPKVPKGMPLGGMGIGIKLPGLGAGFPVLKKTQRTVRDETSQETPSKESETKPEEKSDSPKQDEPQRKPKWMPPRQPGFGNPLMSELKSKLKKTTEE